MSAIPTAFKHKGWIVFPRFISSNLVDELNTELENSIRIRRSIQIRNGIEQETDGTAHHVLADAPSYLKLLEALNFDNLFTEYFNGKYILNSYGAFSNNSNGSTYANRIHRDVRSFHPEEKMLINLLVMLDEFTITNGATWVLSGSHRVEAKPDDEAFFSSAERVVGEKGSVLIFDSNLWHAAGTNNTPSPRRAITITLSRPYFKPQFDYCRALGYEFGETLSGNLKQIIGYNARVPSTLEEYYQPPEKRMYKRDQG